MSRNKSVVDGLGARIREGRGAKGLTQDDLARRVGVRCLAISEIELGKVMPKVETLLAIADELEIPIETLLGRATSQPAA